MRKVELRMNEKYKYNIIKNLVEKNGNKKNAAIKLRCTVRTINNLISRFNEYGKEGFIHGNRDRKPSSTINEIFVEDFIELYTDKDSDFNWNHLKDIIEEYENITVSYGFIYNTLTNAGFISPKCHRDTRTKKAKEIASKISNNKNLSNIEKDLVVERNILQPEKVHPRISRSKYFDESIQMDASVHLWFGDKKTFLHAAIDDCTGMIVGAYFDEQETLNGYYNVTCQILSKYGIPASFKTDRRTIFEYSKLKDSSVENDTFTQFAYACDQLGIELITTSIPQAKGRIERLFGTLQSRLIAELRLAGPQNVDSANKFLDSYIKKFNKRFALPINNINSVFESKPSTEKINNTLAVISNRVFDNGSSIKYKNNYYQAFDQNGEIICFKSKIKCLVIKTLDNRMICSVGDNIYQLKLLESHKSESREFDMILETSSVKKRKVYIPPMTHPWKAPSFNAFISKQKHLKNSANV